MEQTTAENEETATARYGAGHVSTQSMLKAMFQIVATMTDDPDRSRSNMRTKLLELADTMPPAQLVGLREKEVRTFVTGTFRNC